MSAWARPRRGRLAAAALAVVAAAGGWSLYRQYSRIAAVPVATIARGTFTDEVRVRGEVRPLRSLMISAPMSSGDLRIVKLARNGTAVRKGDVIVAFDTAPLQRTLDEKRSELRQAEAEIDRLRGDSRLQVEQDVTDVAKAGYDVERARLDASTGELIPRVEAEKFKLVLADAEQKRREIEMKLDANRRGAAADLDSRRQKRDKAALEVAKAERDIRALSLVAPAEGTISILDNWRAVGMSSSRREFREGDRAWPGAAIAEVPDLSAVEIVANIDEADRGRIREEQQAAIRVDALPDRELPARVQTISTLAKVVFDGWPPIKQFEMRLRLTEPDTRLKAGMSATANVATERFDRQLLLPAKAVFHKNARQVVYVRSGLRWLERTVVTGRGNAELLVATAGVAEGDRVALRDPVASANEGTRQ